MTIVASHLVLHCRKVFTLSFKIPFFFAKRRGENTKILNWE